MPTKVRIELAQRGRCSRVWLDGVEVTHGLRGVTVGAHVDSITEVVLTLGVATVEVEGEAGRVLARCEPEPFRSEPFPQGSGVLQDGSTPERMRG